jgi:hypothetical protein
MREDKFLEQIERLEAACNFTIHKGALATWKSEIENAGISEDIDLENGVTRRILSGAKYFPTVGELILDCHEERGRRLRDLHEKVKNQQADSLEDTFKKAAKRSGTKLSRECCELVVSKCNGEIDGEGFNKQMKDLEQRYPKFRSNNA